MFSNKSDKYKVEESVNSNNIIGKGTIFKGDIDSSGNLRIEGKVVGNIHCKAKVVLGPTAQINGDLHSQNAEIGGAVNGKIITKKLLVLNATALVHGDILAGNLIIESGANFTGGCKMNNSIPQVEMKSIGTNTLKSDKNIKVA